MQNKTRTEKKTERKEEKSKWNGLRRDDDDARPFIFYRIQVLQGETKLNRIEIVTFRMCKGQTLSQQGKKAKIFSPAKQEDCKDWRRLFFVWVRFCTKNIFRLCKIKILKMSIAKKIRLTKVKYFISHFFFCSLLMNS